MAAPRLYVVPEHEFEAAHGLPEALPRGEALLWQGAPEWKSLAIEAFHVRKVAIYFAVILALRAGFLLSDGATAADALAGALMLLPFAVFACGALSLLAWLTARTAVYTLTSERLVMRVGIVLTVTYNLPFRVIHGVDLTRRADGSGNIALTLGGPDRIAYLHLWPHARPWRLKRPEPMMRSLPNVEAVANQMADAITAASGGVRNQLASSEADRPRATSAPDTTLAPAA
jgi:hypothetical protein